jgi:hypothetical protein
MGSNADETATFAIDLQDGTSGPAEAAAKALEGLKRKIDADTTALGQMQKALRNLKQATVPNLPQIAELGKRIDAQKQSIAGAQSSYISLGGNFDKGKRGASGFAARLGDLSKVAQGMPGPVGGLVSRFQSLSGILARGAMVAGIAAIAAVLVAVAVAAVVAAAALLKYGIASANARRSELLRLEGLTKMRNWYGIAAGNAKGMQAAIDKVSGSTSLGRDKLSEYTSELYKMGLRGDNLALALEGAAIKGAVLGDESAKGFMAMAAGAAMAGGSVKRLSDDVKARLGGIAAAQLLDLNVQAEKMRENFGALFSALKIEPLLKGISAVTSLFSQSTRSGQALKAIMGAVFQPIVDSITYVMPIVKRFFQGVIIASLLVGIAVLRVRKWLRETFGDSQLVSRTYLMRGALLAGAAAVGVFLLLLSPFIAMVGALAGQLFLAAAAATFVWKWLGKGYDAIKNLDWGKLGRSIVEGLVGGLKASAKWLIDTISKLGTDALDALSRKLGIASPSKAFARLGLAIPQGITTGVEAGKPGTRSAVAGLVDVPRVPPAPDAAPGAQPAARASSTITIEVGGITVSTTAERAGEMAADVERELVPVFERIALQLGASLPRVPA